MTGIVLDVLENGEEIHSHVVDLYRKLYSDPMLIRPKLDRIMIINLDGYQRDLVERLFGEIRKVVCDLKGDKAPGPNGYSTVF